ncbi:NADH-quinone oxidoreductase subunit NuoE [Bacteroidota bacterium]
MIEIKDNILTDEIRELVSKFGEGRESLLPVLQEIQLKHGYISEFAQQEIAHVLDIHPVEVYGVITFYSFLSNERKGRYIIRLCRTISCDLAGKDAIVRTLERELGIAFGETTKDEKFSLEFINCMGMCDQGPAMIINDQVFTDLTPHRVVDILKNFK